MKENKSSKLFLKRVFNAPREEVFKAWTAAEALKRWWCADESWSTPITEIDLRVGGKYRLGMQAPDKEFPYVVTGTYREIRVPEKLVYTWQWEGQENKETLVTVEFRELGNATEVRLTHEYFISDSEREEHEKGWMGCLNQLEKLLTQNAQEPLK